MSYDFGMKLVLKSYYDDLGIDPIHLSMNRLEFYDQAPLRNLEVVDLDFAGRPFILTSATAVAWRQMREAAIADKVILNPASGFRSYLYQKKLIETQLARGRTIIDILKGNALPGFSEHHSGRAVDICANQSIPENEFHQTATFAWMMKNAGQFNFSLSYPQDNTLGMIFEPWHWLFLE
jgi:D-alanyl-D-alanine carboxypeptidase